MIREATVDDRLRIIEMTTRFIIETQYHHWLAGATSYRIAAYVDDVLQGGMVWLAELAGDEPRWEQGVPRSRVIGMLALIAYEHPLTGRRVGEELAWWVEPEHRGGTAAGRLERHMLRWSVQNQLHMVKMVAPSGSSVGDFYDKRGYQALETHWIKVLADGTDDKPGDRSSPGRRPIGG